MTRNNSRVHVVGERVLGTPGNPISMAMTLRSLTTSDEAMQLGLEAARQQPSTASAGPQESTSAAERPLDVTYFGALLFKRCA